ncbi:DUF2188 domain-containing protein [Verrucomicrobium sp. 3C]|uniref:DUF2188 domain-containing protein n=1 Tax=Verrucomicrobium sp. 3C TaxID=1134055 RepID=UPI000376D996|nr:DUF2188 domain-containing protein [Verrucomicrobium sp. 3C]
MAKNLFFIERRPAEGDYAVRRPQSERASAVFPIQAEAIQWGRQHGARVLVERVRNTKEGHPDHWRRP